MKKEAFELLHEAEDSWWYKGRSLAIRAMLARAGVKGPVNSILDFGAGFGGMYTELARLSSQIYAFEPEASARTVAAQQGYTATYTTAEEALSRQYNLIGLFDVIEHIEDDRTFLLSLREALVPEGLLIITVPAFQFLWSEHDVTHQHFRRYTRQLLTTALEATGYKIVAVSYWNMLLFLPATPLRLMGHSGSSTLAGGFLHWIFIWIVTIEAFFIRIFSLPFGISLVVVAQKREP